MGALLSLFADWLGPLLYGLFRWLVGSIGPSVLASLGLSVAFYTGLTVAFSYFSTYLLSYQGMTADMLDIARLAGVTFVLKLFLSAFSARLSMLAAKSFFIRSSSS